jgi:magnesium transporter
LLTYYRYVNGKIEQPEEFDPALLTEDALHWIDLEDPTVKEATILEDPFHFHPLAIEDCLAEVHHPKVDDYEAYIFVIIHGMRFDAPTDSFITRELDVFLGKNYLITHHKGPMRSIGTLREMCSKNLVNSLPKGTDFLLHQILDLLFEHYFPNLDAIEDKVQLVQIEVFENPTRETLDRVFALKRDVLQLRRICAPQREIVNRLARAEFKVISPRAAVYFRDIYDNLYRIVEASFSYQDIVQSLLDAYLSAVSNRLNETMKRLTVIGAIMAALTVITGVYGMNFESMPELKWRFGYAFVWGVMFAVTAGLYWFFKKKDWI